MKRKIIRIDDELCTGCGECIPNCPEGAIQLIDGKARLVSDLFCDGLGACLGHCPEDAISIEEREAEPYDEREVMENIVKQGKNVIRAHLEHLRDHGEAGYLKEALRVLEEKGLENPLGEAEEKKPPTPLPGSGCPGARALDFSKVEEPGEALQGRRPSALAQWPIQLHLVSPLATYFQGADILLAADCVAFTVGDFHQDHLKGKALAIACPKLDGDQEVYEEKLRALVDHAKINTLTVMIMQVPCCSGLLRLAQQALAGASRKIPLKLMVVSVRGRSFHEEWVQQNEAAG